jgi:hypothetical protein
MILIPYLPNNSRQPFLLLTIASNSSRYDNLSTCVSFDVTSVSPLQFLGVEAKWSWEQLLASLEAFPPMSAKRSTTDEPKNFSIQNNFDNKGDL